jgi:hypothetical protein
MWLSLGPADHIPGSRPSTIRKKVRKKMVPRMAEIIRRKEKLRNLSEQIGDAAG